MNMIILIDKDSHCIVYGDFSFFFLFLCVGAPINNVLRIKLILLFYKLMLSSIKKRPFTILNNIEELKEKISVT